MTTERYLKIERRRVMGNLCKTCEFSEWHLTQTGRISRTLSGRCTATVYLPELPASVEVVLHRRPIWPDEKRMCTLWKKKD